MKAACHLLSIVRSGQLRFRLETYGVYYPALPDKRGAWRLSVPATFQLLRNARLYLGWVDDLHRIAANGPHEWWGRRMPGIDLAGAVRRLERE